MMSMNRQYLKIFVFIVFTVGTPVLAGSQTAGGIGVHKMESLGFADSGASMGTGNSRAASVELIARNAVYLELFGSGIFYSLNYEYRFDPHVAIRGGGCIISSKNGKRDFTNLLLMGIFLPKAHGSTFEYGAGGIVVRERDADGSLISGLAGGLAFGYRWQPVDHGVLLRVTWTPYIYGGFKHVGSWAGISLGYTF